MVLSVWVSHAPFSLQIDAKREQLSDAKRELKSAKADAKVRRDEKSKKWVIPEVWCRRIHASPFVTFLWPWVFGCFVRRAVESKKKAVQRVEEQLMKLEVQATDREENKQIALGTSKLNYLDPRISVAWYENRPCPLWFPFQAPQCKSSIS